MSTIALLGLGVALWYALACWWFPMANCSCCHGSGKHRSKSGKTWRPCWWCSGRGSGIRFGRRLWHWFRGESP